MAVTEQELTTPWEALLVGPAGGGAGTGALVLGGSSGRVNRVRARLLAEQGVLALAVRWFGGPGQVPGVCEVPLETFVAAVDLLKSHGVERIVVLGTSKGAEAAMLTAVHDPRVDAVVAFSPTPVVWCNAGPGLDGRNRPLRSSWTWRGAPLPFVPIDEEWRPTEPEGTPVAILGWYELSERTFADRLPAAAIPVERTRAELLLIAGAADAMWPSLRYAGQLAARRRESGLPATVISHPEAGHGTLLPGEPAPAPSTVYAYGGTPATDAALGRAAWPEILKLLAPST
ncbi:acyl-CoA thioester hydrolase/BAAT C-terminal domain-containing protein [Kitasatospora sp. NPDC096147]|uniref:acyl-CoA thioester hydrolase/BAAT C-terminal domain-containing protein n=1 Tax=Kitasatospora sp. NPDC096147 TaxID=3364093 RepID=UPI0038010055